MIFEFEDYAPVNGQGVASTVISALAVTLGELIEHRG
jgi:hypothetical protein